MDGWFVKDSFYSSSSSLGHHLSITWVSEATETFRCRSVILFNQSFNIRWRKDTTVNDMTCMLISNIKFQQKSILTNVKTRNEYFLTLKLSNLVSFRALILSEFKKNIFDYIFSQFIQFRTTLFFFFWKVLRPKNSPD